MREADSWLSLYVSKTAVLIGDGRGRVREQEVASVKKGKWSRAAYFVCRKTAVLIGDGRSRRGNREADSWLSLYVSKTAVLIGDGRSRVREQEVASVKKGKWSRAAYFVCRKTAVLIGDGRSRAA